MTPSSSDRADHIFAAALDHDPVHREAYLEKACGESGELLADVRALLAASEAAPGSFLDSPAAAAHAQGDLIVTGTLDRGAMRDTAISRTASAWEPPTPEQLQQHFPQYKVLELIGRGGMGAVYKGLQLSLDRYVAIKILPPNLEDEEFDFTARFKQEAKTMARLRHPGIVPVYSSGQTISGLLHFVMEYVEGTDVATMIKEQGRLPPVQALAITAHVCEALQYAHSHGVIHRDVKPANVMVDREGVVKVTDFGLAKFTAHPGSGLTQPSLAMGTPVFIAPEMFNSGIAADHRADLYAVGVMLYQMLTGELPRGAFTLPSKKVSSLDARHDEIVLKAMKVEREERYVSASEFRQQIEHILTGPGLKEEAAMSHAAIGAPGEAAPKHDKSWLIASLGLVSAAVIAGGFYLSSPGPKVHDGKVAATPKATLAPEIISILGEQPKDQSANSSGKQAAPLSGTLLAGEEQLKLRRESLGPEHADTLGAMTNLAMSYHMAARLPEATALQEQAVVIMRRVLPENDPKLEVVLESLARFYSDAGRWAESLKLREEVLGLRRKALGPEHPSLLGAMTNLAIAYRETGRLAEGITLQEQTLAIKRRVLPETHHFLAVALQNLGILYAMTNRKDEALKLREELLALCRKSTGRLHPEMLPAMSNLANSYFYAGRQEEALKLQQDSVALHRTELGVENPKTLMDMSRLANFYHDLQRDSEALKLREEVLPLRLKVSGREHPDTLAAMTNLSLSYSRAGRLSEAITLQEHALTLKRHHLPKSHPFLAVALRNLADLYGMTQRPEEAKALREELAEIRAKRTESPPGPR